MKVVVAASPKVAISPIKSLINAGHQVVITTLVDQIAGRGRKLKPTPVAVEFPAARKLESESELQELLVDTDLLITIGFGWILKPETLSVPKLGGINLHFSLLPRWRGAAPVQRALEAGDTLSGVTVFQMDQGMDTGPIWMQKECEIKPNDDALSLFQKLSELGAIALLDSIVLIENGGKPYLQSGTPSIARKITKEESRIEWHKPATEILNKIRAFAENPVASAKIRGEILKIVRAEDSDIELEIGHLSPHGDVGTGKGSIRLIQVIPAGSREMSAQDWLNGFKVQNGESFE